MEDVLRVAGFTNESVVDGKGLRFTVFCQGCFHNCPGCHNPETHDSSAGFDINISEIEEMIFSNPLLDGVTLSGGEPMLQPKPLIKLCKGVVERGLGVWVYTGYTFKELMDQNDPDRLELLALADVIVDGRFELSLRTFEKPFAGSSNQRLLDAKKSIAAGKAVSYNL